MKRLLFILLAIAISFSTNAQLFNEIYRTDKLSIEKYQNNQNYYPINFIENFDNDDVLIHINDSISSIVSVDNNLNVLSNTNISNNIYPCFKLNNKIYCYYYSIDSTFNLSHFNLCSIDNTGNILSTNIVYSSNDDTLNWEFQKVILLKNKEILFSFLSNPINPFPSYYDAIKLVKVDTMGNVLKTKIIYDSLVRIDIGDIDNNILLSTNKGYNYNLSIQNNFIYYLNRETLEKEDSIKGYSTNNLKKINDSILTFYGNFGPTFYYLPDLYIYILNNYYIMNKNTKIIYPIIPIYNFLYDNVMINWYDFYGDTPPESNKIDFINQDSIYSIFYLYKEEIFYDSLVGCGIVNYSISGDTNFVYKLLNNHPGIDNIGLIGIKATNDGGAIINLYFNNHPCLAKFMPNGLASILDIATKEKETIKVYPNPARDYVNVDIECTNFKASDIELLDMQGRIVKTAKLNAKQGNRIDVSSLSAGAYTYNVSLNGKTISGKIIIGK